VAGGAGAPAWPSGGPAHMVLTGGFGSDDEVSDVVPTRRRGRIVQIIIAGVGVLAVAVAAAALAGAAAHRHASTPFGLMAMLNNTGGVAFSPDGQTLATGPDLWNVAARHRMATLTDPGAYSVNAVAFSPDGHTLAIGDYNGSYLWHVR
jgi:hypothetical protein